MKIKCPFCGEKSVNLKESDPLAWHFVKEHKYSQDGMAGEYADLIFKIHEKIEFHKEHKKYNTKGGLSRQTIIFDFRIAEILESLLQE
jgi:hypothetical protein